MEWLLEPQIWVAFLTLTVLEIVLGIDNLIFIAILVARLPKPLQARARAIGLSLALVMRVLLLLSISWLAGLTEPLFTVAGHDFSGRDLVLLAGGLFLLYKGTKEIHHSLEGSGEDGHRAIEAGFAAVIAQIVVIDLVFSFDSVITAVGLVNQIPVMIAAIVVAMGVMLWASGPIAAFIDRHPSIKMLALSFIILVGFALMGEGLGLHIPKGYLYFAMAFSVTVELLNISARRKSQPVVLHPGMQAEASRAD